MASQVFSHRALARAPDNAAPGIAGFELLKCIGAGAYGEVWMARTVLGELRAVKIVRRSAFGDDPRPFERELAGIRRYEPLSRTDPSQVAILHVDRADDDSYFYYVMELADAAVLENDGGKLRAESGGPQGYSESFIANYTPRTLRHDLRTQGALPVTHVVKLGLALTRALAHLHARGLVHRDVKPSNIIFVGGQPKLADIGLVTHAVVGDDAQSIVGTEGYLPPEGPGTPRADLFALGKVLYETAIGRDRRDFPDLPLAWPEVPERTALLELNEVILKACAADARNRYASAEAMGADLARLAAGRSLKTHHAVQRLWKSAGWALAAFAAVGLLVFGGMRLQMASGTAAKFSRHGWTTHQEASDLWDKANYLQSQGSPAAYGTARRYLERAIQLDPRFAYGYAGLANQAYLEAAAGLRPPEGAYAEAAGWARRALNLEPRVGYAHTLLGECLARGDRDWTKAESSLRQGIELDPDEGRLRIGYALAVLLPLARFNEALTQVQQAIRSEPSNADFLCSRAQVLYFAGRYPQALQEIEQIRELRPDLRWNLNLQAQTLLALNRYDEAVAVCEEVVRRTPTLVWPRALLLYAQTLAGKVSADAPTLRQLLERAEEPRAAFGLCLAYLALREQAEALRWLTIACDRRDGDAILINVDPRLAPLRAEPGFHEVRKRVNLE